MTWSTTRTTAAASKASRIGRTRSLSTAVGACVASTTTTSGWYRRHARGAAGGSTGEASSAADDAFNAWCEDVGEQRRLIAHDHDAYRGRPVVATRHPMALSSEDVGPSLTTWLPYNRL